MHIEVVTFTYHLSLVAKSEKVIDVTNKYIVDSDLQAVNRVFPTSVEDFKQIVKSKLIQDETLSAETRVMFITFMEQLDQITTELCTKKQVLVSIREDIFAVKNLFPSYMRRGMIVTRSTTIERVKDIRPSSCTGPAYIPSN